MFCSLDRNVKYLALPVITGIDGLQLTIVVAEAHPVPPRPATEVVLAASDSTGIADYKCSGSNDQLVVQHAINVAASAGKKLIVKAGHYQLAPQGSYILQLVDNTIMDCDANAIFQVVDRSFTAGQNPSFFASKGFTWWPIAASNRIKNVEIYNLTIELGATPHVKLNAADHDHPSGYYDYHVILGIIDGLKLGGVNIKSSDPQLMHLVRFFLWHCNAVLMQQCQFDGIHSWAFCYDPNEPHNYSKWDGHGFTVDNCVWRNYTSARHAAGECSTGGPTIMSSAILCIVSPSRALIYS